MKDAHFTKNLQCMKILQQILRTDTLYASKYITRPGYEVSPTNGICQLPGTCDPSAPEPCDRRKHEECLPDASAGYNVGRYTCQCGPNHRRHPVTGICCMFVVIYNLFFPHFSEADEFLYEGWMKSKRKAKKRRENYIHNSWLYINFLIISTSEFCLVSSAFLNCEFVTAFWKAKCASSQQKL